jgi:hypothetical protein
MRDYTDDAFTGMMEKKPKDVTRQIEKGIWICSIGLSIPLMVLFSMTFLPVEIEATGVVAPYGCTECHPDEVAK